jgi:microcystin-dependent protein
MSTEPFIGEIKIFGFDFAPKYYANCNGQLLQIAQNSALFALLGTTYGGNGSVTFGLPDLRGRMPIGQGTGQGLPSHSMGEMSGTTNVTLLSSNLPAHNHSAQGITVSVPVANANGDVSDPSGAFLAKGSSDVYSSVASAANYGALNIGGLTGVIGSNYPVDITNPYLVINYSIAINGIFPSRN